MSDHPVISLRVYFSVFGALMVGTALTTAAAYVDLGAWNTVIALSIAMAKVAVVVLYFMHVKFSSKLVWIFAISGAYWLLIFFGFLMSDYLTRTPVRGWADLALSAG